MRAEGRRRVASGAASSLTVELLDAVQPDLRECGVALLGPGSEASLGGRVGLEGLGERHAHLARIDAIDGGLPDIAINVGGASC